MGEREGGREGVGEREGGRAMGGGRQAVVYGREGGRRAYPHSLIQNKHRQT